MRVILTFTILICFVELSAQQRDSVRILETQEQATIDSIESVKLPKIKRPGQALKWAIIPGGGQVYNRAWWKVPLVYGGLLGAVGYADFNQTNYARAVSALKAKCFGVDDPDNCVETTHEFTGTSLDDIPSLRNIRDNFDKQRQSAYIFIFLAYLLQGVEAFTDAHLKSFDVSDDLSLFKIGPTHQPGELMGVGLTIPLGSGRQQRLESARLRALVR